VGADTSGKCHCGSEGGTPSGKKEAYSHHKGDVKTNTFYEY